MRSRFVSLRNKTCLMGSTLSSSTMGEISSFVHGLPDHIVCGAGAEEEDPPLIVLECAFSARLAFPPRHARHGRASLGLSCFFGACSREISGGAGQFFAKLGAAATHNMGLLGFRQDLEDVVRR
jgi:hypothetical protein